MSLLLSLAMVQPISTAMTGGNFEIYGDVFSFTSEQVSNGGTYALFDTGGEFFATSTSGGNLILDGGFQALEKGILFFNVSDASIALGTLSLGAINSASVTVTASTDSASGLTIAMSEDGNLCSPSVAECDNDINDVVDGAVTIGEEEYGITTSGTYGQQNGTDAAITGSTAVASASGPVVAAETVVTHKAAINIRTTRQGSYTHTVTYTLTINP